jgi:flagellin
MQVESVVGPTNLLQAIARREEEAQEIGTRLATGRRLTRAAADVAGYAIGEVMRAEALGLTQKIRGAQEAISREQVREAGQEAIGEALARMRELSIRAAGGLLTPSQRRMIQEEVEQMKEEITRIAETTKFKGVGVIEELTAEELGVSEISVETAPEEALGKVEEAIGEILAKRAEVGAETRKYESRIAQYMVQREETLAAQARITEADIAEEVMELTQSQILGEVSEALATQGTPEGEVVAGLVA